LPWQGLKVDKDEDRYKKIYEKKKNTKTDELCMGHPIEFANYITYTKNLGYEQDPNYDYLRGLFKTMIEKNSFELDFKFDWVKPTDKKNINNTITSLHPNNSLHSNNIILNNLQQNKNEKESKNMSFEKNNKIINTNTNIIINTAKNKDIQISQEVVNNIKINITNPNGTFKMDKNNIKKISVNNSIQVNKNDTIGNNLVSSIPNNTTHLPNNSAIPVKYDNFLTQNINNIQPDEKNNDKKENNVANVENLFLNQKKEK